MNNNDRPVLSQINLVARDMTATIDFYRRLGVEVAPTEPQWELQHRNVEVPGDFDFELDSSESAALWNKGWRPDQSGAVLGFRVVERATVDAIFADLTGAGTRGNNRRTTRSGARVTRSSPILMACRSAS